MVDIQGAIANAQARFQALRPGIIGRGPFRSAPGGAMGIGGGLFSVIASNPTQTLLSTRPMGQSAVVRGPRGDLVNVGKYRLQGSPTNVRKLANGYRLTM